MTKESILTIVSFFYKSFLLLITTVVFALNAEAAKKVKKYSCSPEFDQTSIVVDTKTGRVLHAKNAKNRVYPASLTKLMTVYMAFDAIKSGKLSLDQKLYVSKNAEQMKPSKLGLKEGEFISVRDVIMSLVVRSANDSAVVLAEALAGSDAKLGKLMTAKAHQLGMKDTIFINASGWHHPNQKTTAIDLVKLAMAIKTDHPRFYPLFTTTSFKFRGKTINGHNRVVENYAGAEGLKTGFTCPAGYNLITTASRGNKSLVGVVTGGKSWASRDKTMISLLDKHFGVEHTIKPKSIKAKKKASLKVASHSKPRKKSHTRS